MKPIKVTNQWSKLLDENTSRLVTLDNGPDYMFISISNDGSTTSKLTVEPNEKGRSFKLPEGSSLYGKLQTVKSYEINLEHML